MSENQKKPFVFLKFAIAAVLGLSAIGAALFAQTQPKSTPDGRMTTMHRRVSYYKGLAADYSRPGLVSAEMQTKLIALGQKFVAMKEDVLPDVGPGYTLEQIEKENKEWWPTHCEALRE